MYNNNNNNTMSNDPDIYVFFAYMDVCVINAYPNNASSAHACKNTNLLCTGNFIILYFLNLGYYYKICIIY